MRRTLLLLTLVTGLQAQDGPCATSKELHEIYGADQADRESQPIDWSVVNPRDEERRALVAGILNGAETLCPEDLYHAAMVFQHGRAPQHYLLAQVLASAAAFQGHQGSRWLSAATLDRYLGSVEQSQISGTQYRRKQGEPWTQEPFDRSIVSNAIRELFNVPDLDKQGSRLDRMNGSAQP